MTTCSDCCYRQKFNPNPSYFHHPAGVRGGKDDADTIAFVSEIIGGEYITDEKGASPKKKMPTAISYLEKAIIAGIIATNSPKGKSAAGTDEALS